MEPGDIGSLKVITSTFYNRPDCTREMLSHLSKCNGIEEYVLLCGIEPGFPEVIAEINKYPFKKMCFLNKTLKGCWANKKSIIAEGFKISDYVIHVEDDVILASDALEYFEWCRHYGWDNEILSVTAYSKSEGTNPNIVLRSNQFRSIAWALWRNSINLLNYYGWNGSDAFIMNRFSHKKTVYPMVSRAKHIGVSKGMGSSQEIIDIMNKHGHSPYAYAGLKYHNSMEFIDNYDAYIKALESQVENRPDIREALLHQIEVAKTRDFKRQIIVNHKNEEWIKLDDNNVKSKDLKEYSQYNITLWSDDYSPKEFKYHD